MSERLRNEKRSAGSDGKHHGCSVLKPSKMFLCGPATPNRYSVPREDLVEPRFAHLHVPAKRYFERCSLRNADQVQCFARVVADQQSVGPIVYLQHLTRHCEILAGTTRLGRDSE